MIKKKLALTYTYTSTETQSRQIMQDTCMSLYKWQHSRSVKLWGQHQKWFHMVPQTSGDAKARIFWGKQTRITANTMELHKDANGNCHFGGHCISATPGDAGLSHLNACRVRATVPTATPMKVGTATQLRDENLRKPQMPWPLVQPRPTRVPIPTKMPAAM